MITGRRAFSGDSPLSTLSAILRDEPAPAGQILPGLPREVERIIARCLRKDAGRRFQTMADLKLALEELKEDLDSGSLAPAAAPDKRKPRVWAWMAGIAALAAGVLGGWLLFAPRQTPIALAAVPFTTYPGSERHPTFSPDGNQVAFSWDGEKQDNFDIYVKLIGAGLPLRLTTDAADDFSPAWSPDGGTIAFMRRLPGGRAAVMLIPPLGGPARMLAETRDVTPAMWDSSGSLSWTPDSRYLAVLDKSSADEPVALFLLSVDTGEKRRLTQPAPRIVGDSGPAFSPDGRMLAFTRSTGIVVNDVYVARLSASFSPEGEPQRLTFDNKRAYSPAWMPDGKEIVFTSGRAGVSSLWRMAVAGGGPPQRLASVGEDGLFPAISRQGSRLVYTRSSGDINIWRIELPDARAPRAEPQSLKNSLLIASSRIEVSARISPDGRKIVFGSDRSGFHEIWAADSSGQSQVQLTSSATFSGSPSWSPDGRQVAFDCNLSGHFEIYVMNASGGRPRQLTNGPSDSAIPRWSPDGKWIYFRSVRTGDNQIWKIPAAGGEVVQVTQHGGLVPSVSDDGRFLYYTKAEGSADLFRMPEGGGEETRIVSGVLMRAFAVAREGIYYMTAGPSGKAVLRFYNLATGQTNTLSEFEKPVYLYMDVSPDGRWLVYSRRDQQAADLMLVDNFR